VVQQRTNVRHLIGKIAPRWLAKGLNKEKKKQKGGKLKDPNQPQDGLGRHLGKTKMKAREKNQATETEL